MFDENIKYHHGALLTQEETEGLPDGSQVLVTWSGGNGPWPYKLVVRDGFPPEAVVDGDIHVGWLNFVGNEKYNTHVSVLTSQEK